MTGLLQRVEQNISEPPSAQTRAAGARRRFRRTGFDGAAARARIRSQKKSRWKISVAHFNHQLRGRSSDADEKLVRKTAAAMKLPLVVESRGRETVRADNQNSQSKWPRENCATNFSRALRANRKIKTIALAHHADDQVELFFLRLLRGAGGEGLAGMKWRSPSPADKKIALVRPLLDLTKNELRNLRAKTKSFSATTRQIFPPIFCETGFATNFCRCSAKIISPV